MRRRKFLSGIGVSGVLGLSGCLRFDDTKDTNVNSSESQVPPPTSGSPKVLEYELTELSDMQRSGGVPKDGIPSIDDPKFGDSSAYEDNTFSDNIVFGVDLNGERKAYPRNILTRHEIVNDTIGGENVSVTYCPLTGTAVGFKRGNTTFGVSGNLINNNLVMYDRGTDTRWPQMLGTGISGPHKGESLEEFRVIWTTWDRWLDQYPDTKVLTTDTGYVKNYSIGSYGQYQPRSGYYQLDSDTLLPSLSDSDEFPTKSEFIGGRTGSQSYAVRKGHLREQQIVKFDDKYFVYDSNLDTAYLYQDVDQNLQWSDNEISIDDETYDPSSLPFEKINSYDAMWFAWNGYYPSSNIEP